MSSASGDTAATPAAAARRVSPKLLMVAGASALLFVLSAAGLALWLWPKAADPAEAKTARLAARRAAAQASAPAALPVSAAESAAAQPEPPLVAAAPPVAPSAAAPDALPVMLAAAASEAPPRAPVHAAFPAPPPTSPHTPISEQAAAGEAPLDRLQRRLGEVLGARGAVDPARPGELRVLTRSAHVVPARHAAAMPAPEPRDAANSVAATSPASRAAPRGAAPWRYSGIAGPQAWAKLKPEYRQCATGKRQSPIDIRDGIALDLEPLHLDYRAGGFAVIDNGHTVQVNVAPGNTIEVDGRRYALRQFHFHRPSEERIDGRRFDMDVHLVHEDGEGRLAVVAVLLERGAAQPLLQTVWNHLPLEKNVEVAARAPLDPAQLLPDDRRYYAYMGSLTTPPCDEGVLWLVLQRPVSVSAQQIDVFARLYPMNARPLQSAAGRLIKQSN